MSAPINAMSAPASVTALWDAHRQISRAADALRVLPGIGGLSEGGFTHPLDLASTAAYDVLPALLAVPARTAIEAKMQLCAFAHLLTRDVEGERDIPRHDILLWFTGMTSIMRALDEAGELPDFSLADFMGRGALEDTAARLATLDASDMEPRP
jgi:hypothetical protein